MQYYGILGTGDAKKRVIEDSLADYTDRTEKTTALVPWLGTPPEGMERVYDWLIDHEMTFEIYFEEGDRPPPRAIERAAANVHELRDPVRKLLRDLAEEKGDLLVLFDTDDEDGSNELVFAALDAKIPVLELNNGLAPLTVEGEDEEEPERPAKPEPAQEDTAEPLTEREIRAMSAAEMRAHLKAIGVDTKGLLKADLLDILLKGGTPPAREGQDETVPEAEEVVPPRSADRGVRKLTDTALGVIPEDDEPIGADRDEPDQVELATVVMVLADGTTVVKGGVPLWQLQKLLP